MHLDADVHLVLCSFGRASLAYVEADPLRVGRFDYRSQSAVRTIRASVAGGRNERGRRLVSGRVGCDGRQGTRIAQREDMELTDGTLAFVEAHEPQVKQAMLPLW
jgi:hypothetical protein